MNSPFQNIAQRKEAAISLQQVAGGEIIKNRRGRPPRPNMRKYHVKMDQVLYGELGARANELGVSRAFLIGQAVRAYLKSSNLV